MDKSIVETIKFLPLGGVREGLLILSLLLLCSCEQNQDDVLSKHEMENILYDYHIAQYMASSLPFEERYKSRIYIDAVYEKYGITEAEFDSSLVYYNRHTEDIQDIYEHVKHRLEDYEANLQLESGSNEIRASYTLGGDTADIWSGQRVMMLRDNQYLNKETFTIKADTSFHLNDRFKLQVDFDFIREDQNSRDEQLTACLSIHFKNGKVISAVRSSSYPSHYDINLSPDNGQEIQYLYGFFMLQGKGNKIRSLGIVRNIALYRYHTTSQAYSTDSVTTDSVVTDSVAAAPQITVPLPRIHGERLTPEELRERSSEGIVGPDIKKLPAIRTPNSIGPSRRIKRQNERKR